MMLEIPCTISILSENSATLDCWAGFIEGGAASNDGPIARKYRSSS